MNLALGALVGLVIGLGLAFFVEYLDTSVKTMEDVESLLGVPVLAIIPKNIKLLHKEPGDTPDAEAYRILRTNIEFNRKNPEANAISMVSGGPGEGKSTTLANLAFTSRAGRLHHPDRRRRSSPAGPAHAFSICPTRSA